MGFKYDLTIKEMLEKMGYTKTKEDVLNNQQKEIVRPAVLDDFLTSAVQTSLFSTSDIWVEISGAIYFFYDEIQENIEAEKEYWLKNSETAAESEYYPFYQLPKEQWKDIVSDYLLIGSDFSAGIMEFGICVVDLDKNDPPVYMHHECDSITEWKLYTETVSEFLMRVFCEVLICEMYDTAMDTLKGEGWNAVTLSKEELHDYEIDFDAMTKYPAFYDAEALLGCTYDEDNQILLAIKFHENSGEILYCAAYSKA